MPIGPVAGALDRWLQDIVPGSHAAGYVDVTWFRYPWVVVIGAVIVAAVSLRRDLATSHRLPRRPSPGRRARTGGHQATGRADPRRLAHLSVRVDDRRRGIGHRRHPGRAASLEMGDGGAGGELRVLDDDRGGGPTLALPDRLAWAAASSVWRWSSWSTPWPIGGRTHPRPSPKGRAEPVLTEPAWSWRSAQRSGSVSSGSSASASTCSSTPVCGEGARS